MHKLKIAAVEYVNTLPFLAGIRMSSLNDVTEINCVPPADCAKAFAAGEADIALVPVGVLDELNDYRIITDFAIGSNGPVDTVALLAHRPIEEIKSISLDPDSRTSAKLIRVLASEYWKINVDFFSHADENDQRMAHLLIGDKVKKQENKYKFKYDLGELWTSWLQLPMVFAVWIARHSVPRHVVDQLNQAFEIAIKNIASLPLGSLDNEVYWRHYLQNTIRFQFDEAAKLGLTKFRDLTNNM